MWLKLLALTALGMLAVGAVFVYSSGTAAVPDAELVAQVNGSPVNAVEFKRELERHRAEVIEGFHRTYGAKVDSDFWHADFNGQNPEEALKQRALKELVRTKIELELFRRHGLIEGTSYGDLIREMEKENERRLAAVRAKQPVYGPVPLDEPSFMNIYISKRRNELKEKLSEEELAAGVEDLKRHYEEIKDTLFVSEGKVRFEKISVSYKTAVSGNDGGRGKEQAQATLDMARLLADQGKSLAEAAKELPGGGGTVAVRYTEEELNSQTAGAYYKFQPALYSVLSSGLPVGRISPVFDEAAQGEMVLIKVIGRETGGYKSYEDQTRQVWSSYMDAAYSAYVDRLVDEAHVDIYPKAWDKISVR